MFDTGVGAVTDRALAPRIVGLVTERHGRLDVLANVAGILRTSRTNPARIARANLPPGLPPDRAAAWTTDGETFDLTPLVLDHLGQLGIDLLVVIGGGGNRSWAGARDPGNSPPLGLPQAMDNGGAATQ